MDVLVKFEPDAQVGLFALMCIQYSGNGYGKYVQLRSQAAAPLALLAENQAGA